MKFVDRLIRPAIDRLNALNLTFGLSQAIILSVVCLVIAGAVAYRHVG